MLGDRVTEYAGWIYLAMQEETWRWVLAVVLARNVLVDIVKVTTVYLGDDLDIGVHATGWRLTIVSSRISRVLQNGLKTVALALGLLVSLAGSADTSVTVALALFTTFSLIRGAASVAELPATLRQGRKARPGKLLWGYSLQAGISVAALAVVVGAA